MAHLDRRTSHDTQSAALPPLDPDVLTEPGPPADRPPTVTLRRLLGLATLTPPQAVHIAIEVLDLLDGANEAPGADTDAVAVDRDGAVRLLANHTCRDAGVTADLVDQLSRNADRPVARRSPASAGLLTALGRCATALRDDDLLAARAALVPAARAAELDDERARRELAALVAVPLRPTAEPPAAIPVRTRAPAEPRPSPVVGKPAPHTTRSRRRLVTTIVIALLAVVGTISTIALVRPGSSPNPGASTPPGNSRSHAHQGQQRAATGKPHRHAVPTLGPPSARAISKVTLTPAARCRRGAACAVTVRVWLRPPWLSSLHWHTAAVNQCTRNVRWIAAGSMYARPGWQSAYTTVQLRVPDKKHLALIAVVNRPAKAASRPLLVGRRGCG